MMILEKRWSAVVWGWHRRSKPQTEEMAAVAAAVDEYLLVKQLRCTGVKWPRRIWRLCRYYLSEIDFLPASFAWYIAGCFYDKLHVLYRNIPWKNDHFGGEE